MKFREMAKKVIRRLDVHSPFPRFYPFVMTASEKALFDQVIAGACHYLEFGLGGSSLRAIQKSNAIIYSVESSPDWIACMRRYRLVRRFEGKRLHILPVDIGPVGDWGYPKSNESSDLFEAYSSNVFQAIDASSVDLVLVDGRFRVACVLKVILECHKNPELKILIHDFWHRQQYHIVQKYLNTESRADSLGVFSVMERVDLASVKKDYEEYKLVSG